MGSVIGVLVVSFFCSLSEASLLSSSRIRLHGMAEKSVAARIAERLKGHLDRPIAAILILNTLANTGGAAIAGREYARTFQGEGIAVFTSAFTLAVLLVGEIVPKTLGVRFSHATILWLARPLQFLTWILGPLTWFVQAFTNLIGRGARESGQSPMEDLRAMARLAASSKAIGREEQSIIEAAAQLPRIQVRQLMIHRPDVVFLSLAADDEAILRSARSSMHSRLPLCRDGIDNVIGLVNIKDVLWRLNDADQEDELKRILGEGVREPLFVTEDLDASQLLQLFSRHHEHIAIVRDRSQKVAGVVTLEDVIEEIVGEVDDEFDRSPTNLDRTGAGTWVLGGGTLWADAARALQIPVDDVLPEDRDLDGRYDLNDLAADRLSGKLRTGAAFAVGAWRFKVLRMRRGKVLLLEAYRLGSPQLPASRRRVTV